MWKLLIQILLAACLSIFTLSALAGNCENPRYAAKHCLPDPDPPTGEKTLWVKVFFGDVSSANPDCNTSTCISTTFKVTGTVTCSSQVCDFLRSNESEDLPVIDPTDFFGIPQSQLNLLALTKIRGTQIVPGFCFLTDDFPAVPPWFDQDNPPDPIVYDEPALTRGPVNGFFLRSPVVSTEDAEGMWYAHVWVMSTDMNGVDQQYRFNFGGECGLDSDRCPTLRGTIPPTSPDPGFNGHFENGYAGGVFGSNTNPRGEGQTCRCTVSSKPGCPDHVDMDDPWPASWIQISETPFSAPES